MRFTMSQCIYCQTKLKFRKNKAQSRKDETFLYHNAIAGPCGEVNVVRVTGHTAVSSLNVVGHILTHRVNSLTGAVRA